MIEIKRLDAVEIFAAGAVGKDGHVARVKLAPHGVIGRGEIVPRIIDGHVLMRVGVIAAQRDSDFFELWFLGFHSAPAEKYYKTPHHSICTEFA